MKNLLGEMPLWRKVATVFLCSIVLMGSSCDGSDGAKGDTGESGAPGEQGIPGNDGQAAPSPIPSEFLGQFTDAVVSDDGVVTVDFLLTNDKGDTFIGLSASRVRFTINQLFPEDSGDASYWQSYINTLRNGDTLQAGTESPDPDSGGTLTDHGDGNYTYTYKVNLSSVTTPVEVQYNAENSHRVAMQISGGGYPSYNKTYTWQPSSGATDNIHSRDIVAQGTCNNCHGKGRTYAVELVHPVKN